MFILLIHVIVYTGSLKHWTEVRSRFLLAGIEFHQHPSFPFLHTREPAILAAFGLHTDIVVVSSNVSKAPVETITRLTVITETESVSVDSPVFNIVVSPPSINPTLKLRSSMKQTQQLPPINQASRDRLAVDIS